MKKSVAFMLITALSLFLLSGCSAKSQAPDLPNSAAMISEDAPADGASAANGDLKTNDISQKIPQYGQKIVFSTQLTIETLKFDESYAAILDALAKSGGYVALNEQSGGYERGDSYHTKSAQLSLKVPTDKYTQFMEGTVAFGNILSRRESSEDITARYIDTDARLNTYREQEARLLSLVDKASGIDELMQIENSLSQVRYNIESLESQMATFDNMVSFCTVEIFLSEVSTITVHTSSFFEEIKAAVSGSLRSLVDFLRSAAIFVVYALPYIAIAAVLLVFLVQKSKKKRAKKSENKNQTDNLN